MLRLKTILHLFGLVTVVGTVSTVHSPRIANAAPAQQAELLTNPGFEAFLTPEGKYDYPTIITPDGGGHVAEGWSAWWYNDAGVEYSVPEFDIAPITRDTFRVHSGNAAQQIFRPSVLWQAGVYQQVSVPANASLQFTIWGHAWASFCRQNPRAGKEGEPDVLCDPRNSHQDAANPARMSVGIDPNGGTDWSSSNIVWSQDYAIYDNFAQLLVTAQAKGTKVTVFTFTTFVFPAPINNVYWDDASLVAVGDGSPAPTSAPNATAAPNATNRPPSGDGRVPTQPPSADGSQHHIVRPGDTLGGISLSYDVSAQEIRELNGLTGDLLTVGQDLLIKVASAPPTPTPGEATMTPTPGPPTPTPQEVAEVVPLGQICLTLFDDTNRDGLRDEGEPLVPNGQLSVSGGAFDSATTDGSTDPFCFDQLPDGNYVASATAPEGYALTALGEAPVVISGGTQVNLVFGAAVAAPVEEPVDSTAATRGTLLIVGAIAGVLTVAAGAGFGVYTLLNRKRTATSVEADVEE